LNWTVQNKKDIQVISLYDSLLSFSTLFAISKNNNKVIIEWTHLRVKALIEHYKISIKYNEIFKIRVFDILVLEHVKLMSFFFCIKRVEIQLQNETKKLV
jgi:hypothetical protein